MHMYPICLFRNNTIDLYSHVFALFRKNTLIWTMDIWPSHGLEICKTRCKRHIIFGSKIICFHKEPWISGKKNANKFRDNRHFRMSYPASAQTKRPQSELWAKTLSQNFSEMDVQYVEETTFVLGIRVALVVPKFVDLFMLFPILLELVSLTTRLVYSKHHGDRATAQCSEIWKKIIHVSESTCFPSMCWF